MNKNRNKLSFPYFFDYKPVFFLGWFFYRLFKRVKLDENIKDSLKEMHREGTVVYAIKYLGVLDYLLYHYALRMRRLPYPKITFGMDLSLVMPLGEFFKVLFSRISAYLRYGKIPSPYSTGFYEEALREKTPALVSLLDPSGFTRAFIKSEVNNLHFLLEQQKKTDTPIFIVPQLILFKRSPEKEGFRLRDIFFGFKDNLGTIRKFILFFRYSRSTFIDFAEPVNLKKYLEEQVIEKPMDQITLELKDELINRIDGQKRIILGPIMKSRQQLREIVLQDRDINNLIEKMSENDPKKIRAKKKKAGEYFDEIAADYNSSYVMFFRIGLAWLWKKIFSGIDTIPSELAEIREWARKGPLIYVPSHKSHVDYLVLNYILYYNNMHIPRIAAGQNLSFWPMGYIFRKCGAFFIRRSFQGAKLYAEVFSRYVKALLQEGHPIQFYIEGGRSRNGKLVPPKTGFLSIILQGYEQGYCKDLIFIPTSVIYDRILEERSYRKELGGGTKERENFKQVIQARRFLKTNYGKIYIRFSKPFSLKEYNEAEEISSSVESHRRLAGHVTNSINRVTLITPLSLISTAILTSHRKGFYLSDLKETLGLYLNLARSIDAPVSNDLMDMEKAINDSVALLIEWNIIEHMPEPSGKERIFYFIQDDKKLELEYYKNTIIHFFIHHSFVSTALLAQSEEENNLEMIMSGLRFLRATFGSEFLIDTDEDAKEKTISILRYFQEEGFIKNIPETGGFNITKSGFDKLPSMAALAKTFIESYWIAANVIMQSRDENLKGDNLLKQTINMGKKYYKSGIIDHISAISR
ncbi:MAG: 1-acyl-sn-glycerol-3-phosphate acyltransferase, partial [Deltaproteobacteria bacterium]|nr:1-acyl-sn-glycerol-3-phosphate acyltransferase [Deltaproteobacteria bacterium]